MKESTTVKIWSHSKETAARDALITSVWFNASHALFNLACLIIGGFCGYHLVGWIWLAFAEDLDDQESLPHWGVILAVAGWFAACLKAVYPVLLQNPSYTPPVST
jgi:hypothetical protein